MNLDSYVASFIEQVEVDRALDVQIDKIVAAARDESAHHAVMNRGSRLLAQAIVAPAPAGKAIATIAPIVEQAIAEEDAELAAGEGLGTFLVPLIDLANLVECSARPLAPAARATLTRWLPRFGVSRDDRDASDYWTTGFAALALGDRKLLTRFAPERPFVAGKTFEFNLQGLFAHLAAAIAASAKLADVMPAWRDLIANVAPLRGADSVDEGTLLWIARCVFHGVGGAPVETVARSLHDSLWTATGRTP
jgi:hypothetical protein